MPRSDDIEVGSRKQSAASREPSASEHSESFGSTSSSIKELTDNLDAQSNIEVLEIRSTSRQWVVVSTAQIPDPSLLPESVSIRLFLVEGLTSETIDYFSNIGRDCFLCHRLNVLPYHLSQLNDDYFFGKWPRRVLQNGRQRDIEERITRNRPWNLDMILDPESVGLDHYRYERAKGIVRPHNSLESGAEFNQGYARVAVDDCISVCYKKVDTGLICIVVFDAPHKFRVLSSRSKQRDEASSASFTTSPTAGTAIKKRKTQYIASDGPSFEDCFSKYTPSCQRFRDQLNNPANFAALSKSPQGSIKDIILRFILEDNLEILSDFREALDFIDVHLSDDIILRQRVQQWRYLLGQWKCHLSNDISYISYVSRILHWNRLDSENIYPSNPNAEGTGTSRSLSSPSIQTDLDDLTKEISSLTTRAKSTFHDIMATMSIVESQKAIAQAETISKLTNLAFFFIPLTLTASIFGMNITEWQDKLKAWIWIVVSISIMLLTYAALYFTDLIVALSRSPKYLQAVNVDTTAFKIDRSRLYFVYYSKQTGRAIKKIALFFVSDEALIIFGLLVLLVGWPLGIWAITTKSKIPYGPRVSAGVGFAVGLPFITLMWLAVVGSNEDQNKVREKRRKSGLIAFPFFLAGIGVSIWAVLKYVPLPYGDRVYIAVGLGVGVPCQFTLWVLLLLVSDDTSREPILVTIVLLGALAPSLWAIVTKSSLDLSVKVSLSVGLGVGLPCLVPLIAFCKNA